MLACYYIGETLPIICCFLLFCVDIHKLKSDSQPRQTVKISLRGSSEPISENLLHSTSINTLTAIHELLFQYQLLCLKDLIVASWSRGLLGQNHPHSWPRRPPSSFLNLWNAHFRHSPMIRFKPPHKPPPVNQNKTIHRIISWSRGRKHEICPTSRILRFPTIFLGCPDRVLDTRYDIRPNNRIKLHPWAN